MKPNLRFRHEGAKAPALTTSPLQDFLADYGLEPNEAMSLFRDDRMRRLLGHIKDKATLALIDEEHLEPDGYRLQGLIRGIDSVLAIPSRIKELNDAPPQ